VFQQLEDEKKEEIERNKHIEKKLFIIYKFLDFF